MVEIDVCHALLVDGLVRSFKPTNILECGFGGGRSHNAIARGASYNKNKPKYTLVDSWHDWNFQMPNEVHEAVKRHSLNHKHHEAEENTFSHFSIVTANEGDFVRDAINKKDDKYDFIMSDADHQHTNEWAVDVYIHLLTSPGFLIYHDADNDGYPNLKLIKGYMDDRLAHTIMFNRSTRDDEECARGLLVVYKP